MTVYQVVEDRVMMAEPQTAYVSRIFDVDLIKRTITNPKIYKYISDDFSPSMDEFQPVIHKSVIYLGAYQKGEYLGLFMLHPVNGVTMEVHTCLLPAAWGNAKEFARIVIGWVWANTSTMRIITQVPKYNKLAKKLSLDAGMVEYGVNQSSFLKNNILHDIYLFGVSRGDICH